MIVPDDQLQSSSYSSDSSKMQDSLENEIPHHHHSIPDSTMSPLLHVHHNSQSEVIIPLSTHDNNTSAISTSVINLVLNHPMTTRLKSGAIEKKNYAALLATFPELQSLQLSEEELFIGGFSFVTQNTDIAEPSSFRKASSIPQW